MTPSAALGNRTPEQLKVTELRDELRKRGIQAKGLKKELVDRLEEVLRQEELQQHEALDAVAAAAAVDAEQPVPATPVNKTRSEGHVDDDIQERNDGAASEPFNAGGVDHNEPAETQENTIPASQPLAEEFTESKPLPDALVETQERDPVIPSIALHEEAEKPDAATQNVTDKADQVVTASIPDQPVPAKETLPEDPALEVAEVEAEPANVVYPVEKENVTAGLKDLNESKEEPQEVREEKFETTKESTLSERSTAVVQAVEVDVDEVMGGTEEVFTTAVEKTVTTTVEEQVVSVAPEDRNNTIVLEEQVITMSTTIATGDESAVEIVEEKVTTFEKVEGIVTLVADDEGVKPDTEVSRSLEDKSADIIGEAPMEDAIKVAEEATVVENSKDGAPMDVDADADAVKVSKRKQTDGENNALDATKRRRWNSAKGDNNVSGKETQPLEVQEAAPPSNAPVPSAAALTPKSIPSEKVAITRAPPTRTETSGNGDNRKTRVVPPSAKPATTSLKIDKFLRPFTFKAVKELLAQTGTVEDVWMDQIKTHCYVTYSSVEEATATRNALYNLQWPPQGGRLLTAEFVDPSEVKVRSDGEKAAAAAASTPTSAAPPVNAITPRGGTSANSKASADGPASLPQPSLPLPSREKPKQEVERTPTLDDLFRKTRAKPHIYYLPLTAKEVTDKVAIKNREAASKPTAKT